MNRLGEVLAAIHDARDAYRTLRGQMRSWNHRGGRREAFDREQKERDRQVTALGGSFVSRSVRISVSGSTQLPDTEENRFSVWCRCPGDYRVEPLLSDEPPPGASILVARENQGWWLDPRSGQWWKGSGGHGTLMQVGLSAIRHRSCPAGTSSSAATVRGRVAGVPTLVLRDFPSGPFQPGPLMNIVPGGATSYVADIDLERGVAVRLAAPHPLPFRLLRSSPDLSASMCDRYRRPRSALSSRPKVTSGTWTSTPDRLMGVWWRI